MRGTAHRSLLVALALLAPVAAVAQHEGRVVTLDGERIVLGRVLGRGYFAAIYSGVEGRTGRAVAVKLMRPPRLELRDRFDVELRVSREVVHPNIPKVFGIGALKPDGQRALVMERLAGAPLGDTNLPGRARPVAEAVHVTREVAQALAALHAHGWRHNDLHPGNVLVDGTRVHLIDLASATSIAEGFKVTSTGYYAPEARRGQPGTVSGEVTADIYSAGAILAFLLTGEHPAGPSVAAKIADPRLRAVVEKAMHRDPRRRHQSADAFVTDLEAAVR